jgi:triacylglycerol lipase
MYDLAGERFQTVFLELHDTAGVPKSNWENGEILASQLEQISSYFEGRKLFLIGYSKGAVDAQTALVHFGKHHLAEGVISIAAPHFGSELADLANSRPAGWLANLIGANNEGTKSLQTGVMNYFRSITDELSEVGSNKYYTIAGDKAGPLLSLYSIGGLFIQGTSDGVVSVSSSRLPYGHELAVGDWNHAEIRLGTNVYPVFRETLTTPFPYGEKHRFFQEESEEELAILARGGKQSGTKAPCSLFSAAQVCFRPL